MASRKKLTRRKSGQMEVSAETFDDLKFSEESYSAVAEAAEISDISLIYCQFDMQPEYRSEKGKAEESGKNLRMFFGPSYSSLAYQPDIGAVGAVITWELSVKSGRRKILKLRCDYTCIYHGLEDKDEEAAKAFLRRVGRFATFPYFRSFASQLSWSSGAELPTLPILKEGRPIRRGSQKKSESSAKD